MANSIDTEGMEVEVNKTNMITALIAITAHHLDSCTVPGEDSIPYWYK